MRFLVLILFVTLLAVGCQADPHCRRETALLRAEILDLEDKLAFSRAGVAYDEGTISPYDEIVSSETIVNSNGEQIIYESDVSYSTDPTLYRTTPLEVQHQLFPAKTKSPTSMATPAQSGSNNSIELQTPELESVFPAGNKNDLEKLPLPNTDRSENKRRPTPRRRRSAPEMEITLDSSLLGTEFNSPYQSNKMITEIIVNREASQGQNVDGLRGDEGLNLLVQPRTADGTVYLEAGELSVDLIDPISQQTVGHWQFRPAETELFFASDREQGEGILLHLPWEQNLPTTQKLRAVVSFITSDGRKLTTSSRLRVDPPTADYSPQDPQVAGWTERDTRWEIGTHNQSANGHSNHWIKSRHQLPEHSRQFAQQDAPNDSDGDELIQRPRVKAMPASSTRPATELPRWRPVR